MNTCLYYWLIEPLRAAFKDTPDRQPVFQLTAPLESRACPLAVFVDQNELPEYARLTISPLPDAEIPEQLLPGIQAIREHLFSVLRLTYHPEASLFERPIWSFVEDAADYSIGLSMQEQFSQMRFDAEKSAQIIRGSI